jgi:hypothetical protein
VMEPRMRQWAKWDKKVTEYSEPSVTKGRDEEPPCPNEDEQAKLKIHCYIQYNAIAHTTSGRKIDIDLNDERYGYLKHDVFKDNIKKWNVIVSEIKALDLEGASKFHTVKAIRDDAH